MNFHMKDASMFGEIRENSPKKRILYSVPYFGKTITTTAVESYSSNREPTMAKPIEGVNMRDCKMSLIVLAFGFMCGHLATWNLKPDPRMDKYPLLNSSLTVLAIGVVYIMTSFVWGPWFMRNRKPFNLKNTMLVYNAFQVVFSGWMFYQTCFIAWCFYMSKLLDFVDTMFFVMNKKFEHVSLLHVVHHSCMFLSMYIGIRYVPGGHVSFMGYINTFVHTVMYSYYFLAALGPRVRPYLWWKKYLTKLQLTQFVAIFVHSAQLLFRDCPHVPIGFPIWTCTYATIFFGLFIDFYYKAYTSKAALNKSKEKLANGLNGNVSNGYANGALSNGCVNGSSSKGYSNGYLKTAKTEGTKSCNSSKTVLPEQSSSSL